MVYIFLGNAQKGFFPASRLALRILLPQKRVSRLYYAYLGQSERHPLRSTGMSSIKYLDFTPSIFFVVYVCFILYQLDKTRYT